ncbi:hypothetical protein FRB94_013171 [Tulasnella sp. JGI-2019a]|nr:hypothetical protein FRB94_013171 [Tulasnella sp. JGI-2019a]
MEGNFTRRGVAPGNERQGWHGTPRLCRIGEGPMRTGFCNAENCGVCGIICESFSLDRSGTSGRPGGGFQRFGQGIYTSTASSKSEFYAGDGSQYGAILLTNIVVGNGYKMLVDDQSLTEPPPGYHSVLGEVGVRLNYDETVVYDEDAIRPSWLVIFR